MRSLNKTKLFVIFIISVLLIGCQQKKPPIRVALLEWPPYELAFWAEKNNWFNRDQIELLEYKTPAEVTRAFSTEAVDIVAVTSDFALTLMDRIPETRIFTVIDVSNGGDTVLAKSFMKKGDDFRDKIVGVESGPLGTYMLARFMDKFSIEEGELKIKFVDIPGQEAAWSNNLIDLLITYEPIRSKLKKQGAVELFTSRNIPDEIIDVFLIRESKIDEQRENLQAFVNGWFKAVKDLKQSSPKLLEFMDSRWQDSGINVKELFEEVYVPNYSENKEYLSGKKPGFLEGLNQHEIIMLDKKLMKNRVNKEKLITTSALLLIEQ